MSLLFTDSMTPDGVHVGAAAIGHAAMSTGFVGRAGVVLEDRFGLLPTLGQRGTRPLVLRHACVTWSGTGHVRLLQSSSEVPCRQASPRSLTCVVTQRCACVGMH